jgi:DNA mismatch endonuclease (patch repair protein)
MSRIKGRDTVPELAVRKLAHSHGFRFRLHRRDLPGTPDLTFPKAKKVVLVHGCFWHHHQDSKCRNSAIPKTRREWWIAKLTANVERDKRNLRDLQNNGWEVLTIWECEVRSGVFEVVLLDFLNSLGVTQPACVDREIGQPNRDSN